MVSRDPLAETLRRAATVSPREMIGAVIAASNGRARQALSSEIDAGNLFVQPAHRGTAYEVLLALLQLEGRVAADTPIVFLPSDHVVSNEEIITGSLSNMIDWIVKDPLPVYLLGAVPEGPHNQLGYIIPWHDARQMPAGVYEFVEKPELHEARKLINAGGLWNTFIFGGTMGSMLDLFRPRFEATMAALRRALRSDADRGVEGAALRPVYEGLIHIDFSQDLLTMQKDRLNVLRMPRCGWWPLRSPKRHRPLREAASAADTSGAADAAADSREPSADERSLGKP